MITGTRIPGRSALSDPGNVDPHLQRADDRIERAIAAVAAGHPVVVADDEDRENEGDLIFAAQKATPELMAFMIRHGSGVVCVPMTGDDLDRLAIGPMVARNADPMRTAYTITVDASRGVTTGISAADRTRTAQMLADPASEPADLTRPGHVFPLRARDGGVLERRGHTEAGVDLARLAGVRPAGVICELVNDDGTMMRGPQLRRFAQRHDLIMISIEQLARYRWRHERMVERIAVTRLPTAYGEFTAYGYRSRLTGVEHVALVSGRPGTDAVLARVHSECLTGDVFGSLRCDCGPQLQDAMARIGRDGGVLIYLRGQEGRGIGLVPKLRAYQLQERGRDTVDANLDLGLPADARSYDDAAQILRDLDIASVRLITNNPAKQDGLVRGGIRVVERIDTGTFSGPDNLRYLQTKRDRMGHRLTGLDLAADRDLTTDPGKTSEPGNSAELDESSRSRPTGATS
ncbi:bifunctional 3,4-dihydroxy-2-butanone-4-phosphate synthase/GTP cyclohydrolase II [Microlunatus elymi]|uniref:Riboflavin biosynthesis protein RibBA n=1 Tax=Microlunatus elymi TaxID=2596828 RepID=A0A516PTN8_9ACTN|nr:bifunctional 3,4-dihydroxy-2-butanone-4-phosphate synthase/GTP cyclohydrolase II [Microlunatus elymi]QDP94523.1 bifunctional 3,4-dihydroxy-2-butanone-4-phosphate synthase/GTP cyclohydrolase II [Microlunatus elymi]